MIIIMRPEIRADGPEVEEVVSFLSHFPDTKVKVVESEGEIRPVTEIHLIGPTHNIPIEPIKSIEWVEMVVRVSSKYRQIGRHDIHLQPVGFTYKDIVFNQDSLQIFAGLCAVDNKEHVEEVFQCLQEIGVVTARMGAYKPRTSPYDFQGHGRDCLPYVFELAGKYGIRIVAMEVLRERHIEEIINALDEAGNPTGVMLQVGTRNAQNFELLKAVGSQHQFPVLYKRGMGLTLEESLNACEYIASEGNRHIVFCLRGVKSQLGLPHRNLVDFVHVPVVKRLTRLPVCVDPTHSVGVKAVSSDDILEISHAAAQGVISGANMILIECHPEPKTALCDGPQALTLDELREFVEDMAIVREAYEKRRALKARSSK